MADSPNADRSKLPDLPPPHGVFNAPVGPFCSTRCQMIDLGQWFNEAYQISEPLRPDHLEKYEGLEGEELDVPEN